jgi:hypothetical protein
MTKRISLNDRIRELTELALDIANHLSLACGLQEQWFNPLAREDAEAMIKALKSKRR